MVSSHKKNQQSILNSSRENHNKKVKLSLHPYFLWAKNYSFLQMIVYKNDIFLP